MIRAAALAAALALLVGCRGGSADVDAPRVPPVGEKELAQGRALCGHYVERVCACGAKDAEMEALCALSRSQPEALELQAELLAGANGRLNARERELTEANLRKVVAACVQSDAQLDPARCPRR